MGTWGTGLWSDDTTEEVRDEYLDYLRRGVESRAAVEMLINEFQPDNNIDGHLFWLALAKLQWDYGHLTEEIRDKALAILSSGIDDKRWISAKNSDRKKRKEVLRKLAEQLTQEQCRPKKVRPYGYKRTPWRVGDVISLRFGLMTHPSQKHSEYFPFQDCYGVALVVDFWEEGMGDIYVNPVVALYDWIGRSVASVELLHNTPFIESKMFQNDITGTFHLWSGDVPMKDEYRWYDLKRIGHISDVSPALFPEEPPYLKRTIRWGTLQKGIINYWLEKGRSAPEDKDRRQGDGSSGRQGDGSSVLTN